MNLIEWKKLSYNERQEWLDDALFSEKHDLIQETIGCSHSWIKEHSLSDTSYCDCGAYKIGLNVYSAEYGNWEHAGPLLEKMKNRDIALDWNGDSWEIDYIYVYDGFDNPIDAIIHAYLMGIDNA